MEYKDYYQIMGVGRDASADDIKRAYRRLARKYHPDVSKEKNAEARFKELGEAYEVLRDPEKRAAYDALGTRKPGEDFRPPPDWEFDYGGRRRSRRPQRFLRAAVRRLGRPPRRRFAAAASTRRGRSRSRSRRRSAARSAGCRCNALRSTSAAARNRRRSSSTCEFPPASSTVSRSASRRRASPASAAGRPATCSSQVRLLPHRWFRAEGRDIWLDLPVTPWEAALGETVRVPTLGGRVDLKLPKGSQTDRQLRLRGRGLPGNPPGDQFVVLKIMAPPPSNAAGEALYRQLAATLPFNPRQAMEERVMTDPISATAARRLRRVQPRGAVLGVQRRGGARHRDRGRGHRRADRSDRAQWRFSGVALTRVQRVIRLQHDFGVNLPGAALALELLEELERLRRAQR